MQHEVMIDIIKKTTQTHSGSHIVLHERQLVG